MFSKVISENKIPPNFLDSILTNNSLYEMFRDDFDANIEYFQKISKGEYLNAALLHIENTLFSGNLFKIYDETLKDELIKDSTVLDYIKKFYDDFMLEEFKTSPLSMLKTKFFKGVNFTFLYDKYASNTQKFIDFYNYIFKDSLNYDELISIMIKPLLNKLDTGEKLSVSEFDILCDYVKNNIDFKVSMNLVTGMIKAHAYKINHIFDKDVVKELIESTALDYFKEKNIPFQIEFIHEKGLTKVGSGHSFNPNKIFIEETLIDTFIIGNYVELFNTLFYEMSIIKQGSLLTRNLVDYDTYKVIVNLVSEKVDLNRIFIDDTYEPYSYFSDLKASAFIKTLRFFQSLGVDLFPNYINNKLKILDSDMEVTENSDKKEISTEILFQNRLLKMDEDKINSLISSYPVLKLFYQNDGNRKRTVDILRKVTNENYSECILTYLRSRIIEPESMIDDVNDLISYKSTKEHINEIITNELKYIYVDSFYYSLNSYIELNRYKTNFDFNEYLDDLTVKINCIKDTPVTHRFIDEALFVIEDMKQNYS